MESSDYRGIPRCPPIRALRSPKQSRRSIAVGRIACPRKESRKFFHSFAGLCSNLERDDVQIVMFVFNPAYELLNTELYRRTTSNWSAVGPETADRSVQNLTGFVAAELSKKLDTGHYRDSVEFHFGKVSVLGFVDRFGSRDRGERTELAAATIDRRVVNLRVSCRRSQSSCCSG
jgi:hypothetical protein